MEHSDWTDNSLTALPPDLQSAAGCRTPPMTVKTVRACQMTRGRLPAGCGRSLSRVRPGVSPADRVTVDTAESSTVTWISTCPVSDTWILSGRPPEALAPSPPPAAAEPN